MKYKRLRGTHDIYGKEAELFTDVERKARVVFKIFGFEEIRTPLLEVKELFTHALGAATDIVQKEMYEFTNKSGDAVVLRPEGTAGIVRAYLENHFQKNQGLSKFFYVGPMFRRERPQAGRLRQFHQIGVEQLGTDSPYADAEVIHCLVSLLERLEVRGCFLKINTLGTFDERGSYLVALHDFLKPKTSSLCEDCNRRLSSNVLRVLDCKVETCRRVIEKSPPISGCLSQESRAHFDAVRKTLESTGVAYALDPLMVRGLDYYTRTVFEVTHPKLGAQDAIAAGGRYDQLIESFGGSKVGSVGFAAGMERLVMCLPDSETPAAEAFTNSFFIATLGDEAMKEGFRLLAQLRLSGIRGSMDLSAGSLKSQMRSANQSRSRFAIILGEDELKKKTFVLKDMQSGAQEEAKLQDAVEILKRKIC